ncbi:YueI family protein [Gracilibacillus caseinilyticus]|uniref:YueI family protein n=1 Tax=Gracilibacillus caseinilyticus TaxID=2932256 RepID=A0ABY4EY63_9BACI|nr:YueI family protein [Gracilibacillus caseinilyticus]UOQ49198.1 YueI family protein [Gracilibacillus caseinilyticus]
MANKEIDDYIQEGIYGEKELHPDQKRQYLGTYRERVILVMTKPQVRGEKGLREIEELFMQYQDGALLLNGNMNTKFFKPYRELASQYHISYTYVSNIEADSDYGLVFATDYAVDKEDILLKEDTSESPQTKRKSWFEKLFGI